MVPSHEAESLWPFVSGMVARAMKHAGDYAEADALARVKAGEWQLWVTFEPGRVLAVTITEIAIYPLRKVLWIIATAGDDAALALAAWPRVAAFAKAHGCTGARAFARRGWVRAGKMPHGWRHCMDLVEGALP